MVEEKVVKKQREISDIFYDLIDRISSIVLKEFSEELKKRGIDVDVEEYLDLKLLVSILDSGELKSEAEEKLRRISKCVDSDILEQVEDLGYCIYYKCSQFLDFYDPPVGRGYSPRGRVRKYFGLEKRKIEVNTRFDIGSNSLENAEKAAFFIEHFVLLPDNLLYECLRGSVGRKKSNNNGDDLNNILPETAGLLKDIFLHSRLRCGGTLSIPNRFLDPYAGHIAATMQFDLICRFENFDLIISPLIDRNDYEESMEVYYNRYGEDKRQLYILAVDQFVCEYNDFKPESMGSCKIIRVGFYDILHSFVDLWEKYRETDTFTNETKRLFCMIFNNICLFYENKWTDDFLLPTIYIIIDYPLYI